MIHLDFAFKKNECFWIARLNNQRPTPKNLGKREQVKIIEDG
ncbi:MAG: hypothetical protein Ct9H300mP28_21350 [Pseudomonadota bacterium]|nr:MAG: hypothetical protein Ct9H300mP28_21350 [Pseudomonadota bacterium]